MPKPVTGMATSLPKPTTIIRPLPPEVIAQIKSSTVITSLTGTIIGLLKNSLDASATKINIDVDFTRGSCTITDNGHGILPAEFAVSGGLCKLYHTSRHALSPSTYGTNGTFLASLGALCLLTVTSKHETHYSTNSLVVLHTKIKSRLIPAPIAHSLQGNAEQGTRVVVRDLFGNMAVRVKQRGLLADDTGELDKLWEETKTAVVALLVAFASPVTIHLRDDSTGKKLNLIPPTNGSKVTSMLSAKHQSALSLLRQAGKISASDFSSNTWIPASASSSTINVKGLISLSPSASKQSQYLSLSSDPLDRSAHASLYEHINRLFSRSHFGILPEDEITEAERQRRKSDGRFKNDGGLTRKQMLVEKGVERWPMFVLRIEITEGSRRRGAEVVESEAGLPKVVEVLDALVIRWLEAHHFRPRKSGGEHVPNDERRSLSTMRTTSLKAARPQSARPVSSCSVDSGRQSTPVKLTRPYTGVTSMNTLSRIKSSHGMSFAIANNKVDRPGTVPIAVPSKRPIIEVEPVSFQWLSRKRNTKSNSNVIHQLESNDRHEAQVLPKISAEDGFIDWTDPVTKQKHRLNARTGMRIPDAPLDPLQNTIMHSSASKSRIRPGSRIALPSRPQSATIQQTRTEWLDDVLQKWDNPVFRTCEQTIRQATFGLPKVNEACKRVHSHMDKEMDRAFGEVSTFNENTISKSDLRSALVVAQVDKKFILVRVANRKDKGKALLVAIDQHAADERIKVEGLLRELCSPPSTEVASISSQSTGLKSSINTAMLAKPLKFSVSTREKFLFDRHAKYFATWGIIYDTELDSKEHYLIARTVPPLIIERCTLEPRLLITLLRSELWKREESGAHKSRLQPDLAGEQDEHPWIKRISTCPTQLLDMANSRACRSSIMFNDGLTIYECEALVKQLVECAFPFQCAHGRPSMVPLIELGDGDRSDNLERSEQDGGDGEDFATAFTRWQKEEKTRSNDFTITS